ncbi:MAG: anti-sigma regulatory factor [Oscillospiraceae bacterium]|nr:anti-sigma regulatory factor [Oscillospiraceae bacterium]
MTQSGAIILRYSVCGDDFLHAGEASVDVKGRLKLMGIPAEAIRRAVIALYEAEINLVIHAHGGEIEVGVTPDAVRMRVEDSGPGIEDVSLAMKEGFSTATDEIRDLGFGAGMGLPNMKKHADEFSIESAPGVGTKISMAVRF